MRKGRIDNVCVGNAKHQLPYTDARKQPSLSQKTIIGRAFQFEERLQFTGIIAKARQNTFVAVRISRGNQSMRIILQTSANSRYHSAAAPASVQKLPYAQHSRLAAFNHVRKRSFPAENRVVIWQSYPPVRQLVAV